MTSGQALLAPVPENPSPSPLKLLTGTLEAPGLLEAPASAQPTRRPLGPPRLTHHTHAPCTRGPSPRTRTHTSLPFPAPRKRTRHAHTHIHSHTPGAWVEGDLGGGGLGLQLWPPPRPAASKPPAATPRTELCNWVENCKKNANWKQTQTHSQINLKSIAHPPAPPQTTSCPAAPVGAGGRARCASVWRRGRPRAGVGVLSTHSELGRVSRSWFPWLAPQRRQGPRPRARGVQSCPGPRRRAGGPSPCRAARGGRGGGHPAGPRRC